MQATLRNLNDEQGEVFLSLARFCIGPAWEPTEEKNQLTEDHDDGTPTLSVKAVQTKVVLPAKVFAVDFHDIIVLEGYAGTGKTWTISRMIEYCTKVTNSMKFGWNRAIRFGMTAPTNKAVRVLKDTSQCKASFGTIHSFLGLREKINTRTGELTFEPDTNNMRQLKIEQIDVLVIDEVSMLNRSLFEYLQQYTKRGLKCIFMGDPKQIPPVNEVQSAPFLEEFQKQYNMLKLRLNTIVRQAAGNPILEYATAIRSSVHSPEVKFSFADTDHGNTGIEITGRDINVTKNLLSKFFCSNEFANNSDYVKVLAYRNATVDSFNKMIRALIYKSDSLPKIMEGEKLIADKRIVEPNEHSEDVVLFQTNDEMEIVSLSIGDKKITEDGFETSFKAYYVDAKNLNTKAIRKICIIHEDDEMIYNRFLENLKQKAIAAPKGLKGKAWVAFYDAQKHFAQVKYSYALTVHKSQGSTYDYCFSQEWDIDTNRDFVERNRIRYVAATRARYKLFITK